MKELNSVEENLIQDFAHDLSIVDTIDDMFPPDTRGVREPRQPHPPTLPGYEHVTLAAVYDLAEARRNRRDIMRKSGATILRINQLVGSSI